MQLNLKTFAQIVEDMGATLQSSASALVDISIGSVSRALFEANASVVLWLQWLILLVLQTTRASTSEGVDLDSWMADFSLVRLPATPSSGVVTFTRYTPNLAAVIPVGTSLKTGDGTLTFSIVEDATSSIWQPASASYLVPAGVASANLPVQCLTPGTVGNVIAGSITTIAASLPGVDQVSNAAPLTNGINAEADQQFRSRFQIYLAGLTMATHVAVRSAIMNVRQGLDIYIQENVALSGAPLAGSFLVTIDDGSGYPPATLLSTVATAVDAVRPVGTTFAVQAPQVLIVAISFTATFDIGVTATAAMLSTIEQTVATYLNSMPIGQSASITRVALAAYQAGVGVKNVTSIMINSLTLDAVVAPTTVIKAGQILVTPNVG